MKLSPEGTSLYYEPNYVLILQLRKERSLFIKIWFKDSGFSGTSGHAIKLKTHLPMTVMRVTPLCEHRDNPWQARGQNK